MKIHKNLKGLIQKQFGGIKDIPVGLRDFVKAVNEKYTRHSEILDQYRSMIESIEEGYYEVDLDGRFIFVNSAFCALLGYSIDEIIGKSFRELVLPEMHNRMFMLFHKVFATGVSEKIVQGSFVRKDGIIRHAEGSVALRLDPEGRTIGFGGIIRDVTEKRAMEEALRQSEQKWRVLYNNIPGGSILLDADRTISDVNRITCGITGYGYDELIGEECGIICPENPETCTCPVIKGNLEKIDNAETMLKTKDGRLIPIIKSAQRIRGNEGEAVLVNFHDISRMKEVEEALRTSEENLRKRNQAIEDDIKTAQRIQRAILSTTIPSFEWIRADYRYLPLEAVGGDYFSFIQLREGGLGVFVGDVSSHGVSAALHLSLVKATSERVCRVMALKPADFITTLNDELFGNMPLSFLTAVYGVFTTSGPGEARFTFSSAGHPHPIVVRAGGGAGYLNCKGTIIGMFEELEFHEKSVSLAKGDRIFLYTDGIPETVNENKESVSYDRLPELVLSCNAGTLEATLDNIIGEINRFRGKVDLNDDIVLLGFEYLGT
ncbi:MAG: PAS domain S-box protein [Spirochaetes bacterium]|nr:PAS domain S-box protein [Spirochaetota bacterium]